MSKKSGRYEHCDEERECKTGLICHNNKCIPRGASSAINLNEVSLTDRAIAEMKKKKLQWEHNQGTEEIIKEARGKVAKVKKDIDCKRDGKTMWYQNVVAKFMNTESTVNRLLVAHQLGTGKTRSMLEMIGNYWNDGRPILVIVPRLSLVNNFYDELFEHPCKLRKYVERCLGTVERTNDGKVTLDYRQRCMDLLEMKGKIRDGLART